VGFFSKYLFHKAKEAARPNDWDRRAQCDLGIGKPQINDPSCSSASLATPSVQGKSQVEDGTQLLDQIAAAVGRYVVLPEGAEIIVALWVAHAHALDAAQCSPILAVESPDMGCGKTTLLCVVGALSPMPLFVSDISSAGLYRTISSRRNTLLVDEADSTVLANSALRGILNSGHRRDAAQVVRADGIFSTWCPKVMAMIGELPDTLRDRSLKIGLRRKRRDEDVVPLDAAAVAALKQLAARMAAWTKSHQKELLSAHPTLPENITNRAADNWTPLLAVADLAGGHWPQKSRQAASTAVNSGADSSIGVALLSDIKRIFTAAGSDRIPTTVLVNTLASIEERPWPEWSRGRPMTATQLARLLKPYGIGPQTVRFGAQLAKGYLLIDFDDAFRRYL
jgi:putative DNA primase/helicase